MGYSLNLKYILITQYMWSGFTDLKLIYLSKLLIYNRTPLTSRRVLTVSRVGRKYKTDFVLNFQKLSEIFPIFRGIYVGSDGTQ